MFKLTLKANNYENTIIFNDFEHWTKQLQAVHREYGFDPLKTIIQAYSRFDPDSFLEYGVPKFAGIHGKYHDTEIYITIVDDLPAYIYFYKNQED